MVRAGVLTLISDTPKAHGLFEEVEEEFRDVFCTIKSATYKEHYEALANGLNPSIVFVLTTDADYHGERKCCYEGLEYKIIRTYLNAADGIELTAERWADDA